MSEGKIITADEDLKDILVNSATIAILGLSPKAERDSNMAARYLLEEGYKVIPVNPVEKRILGEKAYPSLAEIDELIDIVNVFRNPAQIMPHARETLAFRPPVKTFWMQLNIENKEAAELLTASGVDVVMNRCIKVEHARFF